MANPSDLVTLRPGCTVPLEVLILAWSLEDKGCSVVVEPGDVLRVGPRDRLTDDDRQAIRRLKPALLELAKYVDAIEVIA